MRGVFWVCLLLAAGCGGRAGRQAPPKWEFGYWFWHGGAGALRTGAVEADAVFVQVGTISFNKYLREGEKWSVHGYWPDALPKAKVYWPVFRFDERGVPESRTAPMLAAALEALRTEALRRGLPLAGVQFDIDSPTRALPEYAKYLREVRKALPPELKISITALLDWFRKGTAVEDVVGAVDEFVPQFYDLSESRGVGGPAQPLAARIDGAKWGPVFNRFGRRFRIGISTFGRSRILGQPYSYGDLKPLDVGINPDFVLERSSTGAKEAVLRYRTPRKTKVRYSEFAAGTAFEFVLSTPESIRAAVDEARKMGEYCGGVVFFRWPSFNESMTVLPDEAMAAAGAGPKPERVAELQALDRQCALVHCADLYLLHTPGLQERAVRYVVRSSAGMEYFLPDEETPARVAGPGQLEFTLPPFGGRTQIHLGQAVTKEKAAYALEVRP